MRVYSQHNKRTTTTDRTRIGIPQYNTVKLDSGPLLTLSVTTVTSHQRGGDNSIMYLNKSIMDICNSVMDIRVA